MVGPKRLERVVNSLRVIAPELPFEIQFKELTEEEEEFEICMEHMILYLQQLTQRRMTRWLVIVSLLHRVRIVNCFGLLLIKITGNVESDTD